MAKVTMTITIEKSIKDQISKVATKMWTNVSNLLSMIAVQFMQN